MQRFGLILFLLASNTVGCGDDSGDDVPELPAWSRELPPAAVSMGERRGLVPARGIIHLHSPYSHDACDGVPRDEDTGAVDEDCLADLRAGLCDTRMDYAALSDHDASMADEEFETLFSMRGTDELIRDAVNNPIASRMTCPNGHTVLITVGGENDLMPIFIDGHPDGTVQEHHDFYNANGPDAVQAFRDAGAVVWVNHAEGHTTDSIRQLAPDGIEIYQLHANIDPNIRKDDLGLDSAGAIKAVVEFADTNEGGPEPDLALMSFIEENTPSINHWNTLLGEGMRLSGSGGTDAHQNALPILLADGERGDSYRRMMRWFANVALVSDPDDPVEIEAAIAAGRFFVAFELFGTPTGFDLIVSGAPGSPIEMGGELAATDGGTIELTLPTVYALDPTLPPPAIRGRILHLGPDGATEVAAGSGPTVTAAVDTAGAYRAEVLITPHHEGPYLRKLGTAMAERERVWVYSNPIYVTP